MRKKPSDISVEDRLVSHEQIMEQLVKHETSILANMANLDKIANTVERIEKEIAPLSMLYEDIAAVGRFGSRLQKILTWAAAVSASVVGLWLLFNGNNFPK